MSTITLNSKVYDVAWDSYDAPRQKSQSVETGLTGKTLIQNFPFTDYWWKMELLVGETETRAGYGDLDDLRTAYGLSTCGFTDLDSTSHTVVIEGELPAKNLEPTAVYKIPMMLRKYQS